ncbi:hypothetical protein GUJ93_ZPchr0012g22131 [Zizania palustris]|uniref:Uncharacterized protein n=1 Tax=Zizania palustris TaxID=103762 RepID=A0A8J5WNB6_ZIZPA|nr:hypothetical protein GUJ93_ZPchr0012g22131 [Zizania palustris]
MLPPSRSPPPPPPAGSLGCTLATAYRLHGRYRRCLPAPQPSLSFPGSPPRAKPPRLSRPRSQAPPTSVSEGVWEAGHFISIFFLGYGQWHCYILRRSGKDIESQEELQMHQS